MPSWCDHFANAIRSRLLGVSGLAHGPPIVPSVMTGLFLVLPPTPHTAHRMAMTASHSTPANASPSDGVASLALALRGLYDQHRRIRLRFASRLGLTPTEFSALLTLAERGDLPPKVLAQELDITPSAVTAMVGHLEAAGFVARVMHPTDRRSVIVTLVGTEGRPATWVLDEYNSSVKDLVREFEWMATPEITGALERTANAMRSIDD